ncbi:lysine 2,3-aminomutase [bacterium]|nr:lysine 2,3-aminomutase [bacterium]
MGINIRDGYYKNVSDSDWNDYKWQFKNRVTTVEELEQIIPLTEDEKNGIKASFSNFKMATTPHYLSLIDTDNPEDPIRLQSIPSEYELYKSPIDLDDPLGEDHDMAAPNLVHRYPDRVLFLITDQCSMYCRFCTRKRLVSDGKHLVDKTILSQAIEYISNHPEIRDVVVSGGDPLFMSDNKIEEVLKALREIPHIEIIRLGSRMPVVCPQRITKEFVEMAKKYHPIYFNTHFNHPYEISDESKKALALLADNGFVLGNQSVLLRKVNSDVNIIKNLMHQLLKNRVRPYYIYQCDLTSGIEHFRAPVSKGIEIIEGLRGHTSGLAVPTFVIDAPNGGGKVPIQPNYFMSQSPDKVIIRNYEGMISTYIESDTRDCSCSTAEQFKIPAKKSNIGLSTLLNGERMTLYPHYSDK